MKIKLLFVLVTCLILTTNATPVLADFQSYDDNVTNYIFETHVYLGIQYSDTELLESSIIQNEIAQLKENVKLFEATIEASSDYLTVEEFIRLKDRITQCRKALESVTA